MKAARRPPKRPLDCIRPCHTKKARRRRAFVVEGDQRAGRSEHVEVSEYLGGAVVDQRHRQVDQMHEYRRLLGSKPLR
jgi:hypothetical protein